MQGVQKSPGDFPKFLVARGKAQNRRIDEKSPNMATLFCTERHEQHEWNAAGWMAIITRQTDT